MARYTMLVSAMVCFFLAMSTVEVTISEADTHGDVSGDMLVTSSNVTVMTDDVLGNMLVTGSNTTVIAENVAGNISVKVPSSVIVTGNVQGDVTLASGACVIVWGEIGGKVTKDDVSTLRREGETCD